MPIYNVLLAAVAPKELYYFTNDEKGEKKKMGSHSNDGLESFVKIPTIKFTKLFINGEFVDSISGFQHTLSHLIFLDFSDSIFTLAFHWFTTFSPTSLFFLEKKSK